ncbi:hypothetical protein AMPC_17070 [Anaeromyxobacter paludicola]|uniref:Uncharacterized protein n=2 Tax=Anaeromyxobacter paludicola TaxID=2918171 RepID=A0ABN6N924_9BACT|nr:hypothetical protein AMPC_17070 [Anaeromyxobacter paludicola]
MTQPLKLGRDAAIIDVGYWWNGPGAPYPALIYSAFHKEPEQLLAFQYDNSEPSVRSFSCFDKTFLTSPMPSDLEPGSMLSVQVGKLMEVLKKSHL